YPSGDGEVKWVSTAWLAEHLEDPGLQIIDAQPNIHDYLRGHIPGALYVEENHFRVSRERPGVFIPPEMAELLFRRLGLRADHPVVVGSSSGPLSACTAFIGDGLEQTMLAYTLARYGHRRVHILDGGIDRWQEEGRPLSQTFPKVVESDFRVQLRKDFYIEYDELKAMKDRPDVILLDARPAAFYEGQGPWPKPGHIPGAVSLPWKGLMDDRNKKLLKPDDQIRAILAEKKITPDKTVLCSCGTGREATNEFCLFRYYLKYPKVKLYEGSFTEWTMYPGNPTVTGKNPR
ncbi:MAG TPA: sulfurtransferase, partial [Methanomicrobiales archaeon]|nr:sulfurtransferase [Methanomicrobiales archaeon]